LGVRRLRAHLARIRGRLLRLLHDPQDSQVYRSSQPLSRTSPPQGVRGGIAAGRLTTGCSGRRCAARR
jgi:hypothetical protein